MARTGSPWLKAVLIPFWVIQLLLMSALIGLASFVLSRESYYYYSPATAPYIAAVLIAAICMILDVTQIILFAKNKLSPLAYLIMNCVTSTIWTIIALIGIVGESIARGGGVATVVSIIILVVVLAMFIATLIYASVVYHRHRKGKRPTRKSLPSSQPVDLELQPYSVCTDAQQNTAYQPLPRSNQNGGNDNITPVNPNAATQTPHPTQPSYSSLPISAEEHPAMRNKNGFNGYSSVSTSEPVPEMYQRAPEIDPASREGRYGADRVGSPSRASKVESDVTTLPPYPASIKDRHSHEQGRLDIPANLRSGERSS
ncbi:MAG: ubiquinone biosynthesis monooxygenase Coq7 [Chaenotheca gracillima]|nr:MAG: ubiquinone biosynthesis monooxygenase Coq7 [Chaenotheca gracillima]